MVGKDKMGWFIVFHVQMEGGKYNGYMYLNFKI